MSEIKMVPLFGKPFTENEIRTLHGRLSKDDPLLGLFKYMREQTKEALAQPVDESPNYYRSQGQAILLKQILTLPEVVQRAIDTLPKA